MADGFDDPEMSSTAANDVFEQRESPWRPGEDIAAAEETREPAAPDVELAAPKPVPSFDPPRLAAQPEAEPPEQPRDLPSREPARPPRFEPLKAELAKLELARSEFARAEAAKSEVARPDHARPDVPRPELPKPELPRFEWPRRDPTRWESARPDSQEPVRAEPTRPPAPAPPLLRGPDEDSLLSPMTTAAVDLAFNTLAQTVLVQNSRTLEDLVHEMLKPMLKAWLDDNLPGLVERLVRAEIERVSRGRS
jgi:uncharacterized protein